MTNLPGVPQRRFRRKLKSQDVERIKRIYAEGATAIEIAKEYNISTKYVQELCPPRKPRRKIT